MLNHMSKIQTRVDMCISKWLLETNLRPKAAFSVLVVEDNLHLEAFLLWIFLFPNLFTGPVHFVNEFLGLCMLCFVCQEAMLGTFPNGEVCRSGRFQLQLLTQVFDVRTLVTSKEPNGFTSILSIHVQAKVSTSLQQSLPGADIGTLIGQLLVKHVVIVASLSIDESLFNTELHELLVLLHCDGLHQLGAVLPHHVADHCLTFVMQLLLVLLICQPNLCLLFLGFPMLQRFTHEGRGRICGIPQQLGHFQDCICGIQRWSSRETPAVRGSQGFHHVANPGDPGLRLMELI
mmetsp:Transcript_36384/g.78474  ORF Transcript_36384/g.78474 Transcript_36384/m.78474 type:complete len:290 (-) Transcript_36384:1412-2281(-)